MKDGFVWVAMPESLARFDGYEFEEIALNSLLGEQSGRVRLAYWNAKSELWLLLDRARAIRLNARGIDRLISGIPESGVTSVAEDGEGNLWMAQRSGTVTCATGQTIRTYTEADGLPDGDAAVMIAADASGRLWWSKGTRLGVLRNQRFETLHNTPGFTIQRLSPSVDGGVWLGVRHKLFKFHEVHGFKDCGFVTPEHLDTRPTALLESRRGGLWVGTSSTGLFFYNGEEFEPVPTSSRIISALAEDNEGNLWAGSENGSINRVQRRAIDVEGSATGLAFETVHSLSEDIHGQLWGVSHSGLPVRRVEGKWEVLSHPAMADGRLTCTATDAEGGVWFGTSYFTLHRLFKGELTSLSGENGLKGRTVRTLLATKEGDMWIGMEGPEVVHRLRGDKLETVPLPPGNYHIRTMIQDSTGTIWMAGTNGVLLRVHNNAIVDESDRVHAEGYTISSLYSDAEGSLWLGTIGGGVGRFKEGRFVRLSTAHGLYDDFIAQMAGDETGAMWFGSQRGLFKAHLKEMADVADRKAERLRSVSYAGRDGLPSLQTNFAHSYGALRSSANQLFFPLGAALAIIDPKRVRDNLEPPTLVVQQVVVDGKRIARYGAFSRATEPVDLRDSGARVSVQPSHHRLEFDFTALSLSGPENVKFKYRLEGLEDRWIDAGTQRTATYSRIAAGDYRFRVAACNRDGVWNEVGATVGLTVTPFIWQRWWFQGIFILVFTGFIVLVVRYLSFRRLRTRLKVVQQEAALDKERTRIARDIHDDLGGRLTKIVLLTGLAHRERTDPEKSQQRIKEISSTARNVIKSLDETVWAINPRNDTLPDLINYIGQHAAEMLHAAEIKYTLELPDHPPSRDISAEARHNIFNVVKEAVNNIVRHAGPCEVRLTLEIDERGLSLLIADTGRGFAAPSGEPGADGLLNMKQRMEEIGGTYEISSGPGKGTTVRAYYPWDAAE